MTRTIRTRSATVTTPGSDGHVKSLFRHVVLLSRGRTHHYAHTMTTPAPSSWTGSHLAKSTGTGTVPPTGFSRRSDAARQVADLLRSDIVDGLYPEALPYEWDLLRDYGATRNVLRDALALLKDQGLLSRTPGAGTFATAPSSFMTLSRTTEAITIYGDGTHGYTLDSPRLSITRLSAQLCDAPQTVRRRLQSDSGRAFFVESLIYFDGEPHRLRTSWVPEEIYPGLLDGDGEGYVPDLLMRALGVELTTTRVLLSATSADRWAAELLGIREHAPVFMSERLVCLPDGRPAEFGFSRYRADRVVVDSRVATL